MGLFKKKPDPISDRSRDLNAKIAELESKIKKLNQELHSGEAPERSAMASRPPESPARHAGEPVFEKVDQHSLKAPAPPPDSPHHFNELGVRKYDLFSIFDRIRKLFRGPPAANPKLVNYLAAGSIQGLRPLRFEKRVARRRFILLLVILTFVCLWILSYVLQRHH